MLRSHVEDRAYLDRTCWTGKNARDQFAGCSGLEPHEGPVLGARKRYVLCTSQIPKWPFTKGLHPSAQSLCYFDL